MAISPNNAFVAGQVLTAQECNNFPFGVVGLVERTAGNLTITNTVADLTGMSVTFTALANRVYRFSVLATGEKATTETWTGIFLTNAANTTYLSSYSTAPAGQYWNGSFSGYVSGFTAGPITVKLRARCDSNTSLVLASAGNPLQLIVEDMGPI
jgi:hypothetical protein